MTQAPETLHDMASRMVDSTPQAAALGITFVSAQTGVATMKVAYRSDLVGDPETGVLAGGVITTLLDHVCGLVAGSSSLQVERGTATLDLRIDYMRPAIPGRDVLATAHCTKMTRSIGFIRATAFEDDPANPIATAQGAFAIGGPSGGAQGGAGAA